MVAIVGGLLVARFISLESEQQGAQRLVDEADGRLKIARERADEAADALRRYGAARFLNQRDVVEAIIDGSLGVEELRRVGGECPLSNEELGPFIAGYRAECERAAQTLDAAIDHPVDISPAEWGRLRDWDRAQRRFPSIPLDPDLPAVWTAVLARIVDAHRDLAVELEQKREERERTTRRTEGGAQSLRAHVEASSRILAPPALPKYALSPPTQVSLVTNLRAAGHHDALRSAADRTEQQVEDIELELKGLRQRRDAIIKPGKQLWPGLLVLAWLSLVGVIIPLHEMSRGPQQFSPFVRWHFWFFVVGYVPLVGYFVWFTVRLSRARTP
jgi:hypothetical protein